ncbi:hypothetical protein H1D24_37250 [Streptomyces sp. PSKA28]|uniref:Uncharacterized protein n=1 Tax=Streptomyces himalayensis subsp. himalayensis TaxID=2756131 RepID=A0A7W0DVP4_9ACTN|nr:hypothetical protein [Streptomyces himalayensis subsp. himalayensis]
MYVDPAYTTAPSAATSTKRTASPRRGSRAGTADRNCGFVDHADRNSSRNTPRPRVGVVATLGRVNDPCSTPGTGYRSSSRFRRRCVTARCCARTSTGPAVRGRGRYSRAGCHTSSRRP